MSTGASRQRIDQLSASPTEVLRRLRHRRRIVALVGAWHHGEALLALDPDRELGPDEDPFDIADVPPAPTDGTFGGGWLGVWGYRLARRLEEVGPEPPRPDPQPDHVLAHYRHVLRRTRGTWWAESLDGPDALATWVEQLSAELFPADGAGASRRLPFEFTPFRSVPAPAEHEAAVARVQEHIVAGDIFQANLCQRLESRFTGDPLDVFCAGVEAIAPAYAAYVAWDDGAVVSLSPELFLRRTGREVLTSPIKGTAPLTADPAELVASTKDRAENIMIVDLMRNDLGRVCEPGSVRVPAMVRAERHSVWHLVSDVVGHLRRDLTDADLLRATFPPGSITGAPKVRAMQVIAQQETTAREAYTGAVGHLSPHAGLELNVAIRTLELSGDRAWLGVGGGIVADSVPSLEQTECLTKAEPILLAVGARPAGPSRLTSSHPGGRTVPTSSRPGVRTAASLEGPRAVFETVLVVDGHAVDLDAHLARLDASVRALHGTTVRAGLESAVAARVAGSTGRQRLRIDAVPSGGSEVALRLALAPLREEPAAWELDVQVVAGGWGAHKWADRDALGPHVPGRDRLLVDTDGSVLETARGSLFVVLDDGVHTPPLDGRILPGTERARVLERLRAAGIGVHQRRLTTADLTRASEVFVTNALRGTVPVTNCPGVGRWSAGPVAALLRDGGAAPAPGPTGGRRGSTRPAGPARVLFVDNYDSFVHNLVQYAGELGATTEVLRNDGADVDALVARRSAGEFTHLVISPGPGTPDDAGISAELVRRLGPTTPTLGVCLGHQVIGEVYGGRVVRAAEVVHGKPSLVHHDGVGVFTGLPSPLSCARYHSLVIEPTSVPGDLVVTARTASGVIMGVRHREHPVEGVQMHPESILTHRGHDMLANFLARPPGP
ncbi:aminodeoxychorismate synthase component I [Tessaracoccus rhinocerotis]|uniref:aminodeoxychorismate synthase component I n=1 Tax=Tessaracoccus rhinocerotis TaxID=1689449 RepID=UPI00163D474D|nr:aminodeoxychorismate synthase component I [Tessaracoccus rhinocerotis]